MLGFTVDVEFIWGFQARAIGLSKTSPSFYYPPPTTFLGSLAGVIAKENNIGENLGRFIINELSKNLLAIGFRPINCIPIKYEDLNRIITVKRTSGILYPDPKNLGKSFDSPARGKTILSSLNGEAPRVRWFLVFRNEEIRVKSDELRFKIEKIILNKDYFWKILRLGSKESVVCVTDVQEFKDRDIQVLTERYVITSYAFPTNSARDSEEKMRKWECEVYINPFIENIYNRESGVLDKYYKNDPNNLIVFRIPMMISFRNVPEYIIRLNNDWKAYHLISHKSEVVVGR